MAIGVHTVYLPIIKGARLLSVSSVKSESLSIDRRPMGIKTY